MFGVGDWTGLEYFIYKSYILIMHLSMFSPTRGRAGIHGHLTRVLSPWVGISILFDITEPPGSGDLTFTSYQSPIYFRKVPITRCKIYCIAVCLYAAFCDVNGTLSSFRFNTF